MDIKLHGKNENLKLILHGTVYVSRINSIIENNEEAKSIVPYHPRKLLHCFTI